MESRYRRGGCVYCKVQGEYRPVEVVAQPEIEEGTVKNVWVLVRDLFKDEQLAKQQEELSQ